METIRVSLVEDDLDYQKLLADCLRSGDGLELVGVYGSAEEFMERFEDSPCDVVVMDIQLPGLSGIECVRRMKERHPGLHISMCTVFEDDDRLFESIKAGAVGYVLKHRAIEGIVDSVKEVYRGGSPISPSIARKLVENFRRVEAPADELEKLTARQRQILELLSRGDRYKEIAAQLFISEETVRTHVRNLYEKLQVQSRMEAVNKVYGKGRKLRE